MCRPVGGSREEGAGGHIGPPLHGVGEAFGNQRELARNGTFLCGAGRSPPPTEERRRSRWVVVTLPYGCNAGGAWQRADVPKVWLPPTKFRAEIWGVGQVVDPYGKPNQPPKPAGAQRSVRASGREGWAGIDARTIPKGGPPPRPPGQRLAKRKARKE